MQSDVALLRPRSSSTQRPIDEALATTLKYVYKASPLTQVQAHISSGFYPVVDVISPVTYHQDVLQTIEKNRLANLF